MTARQWFVAVAVVVLALALALTAMVGGCFILVKRQVDIRDGQSADTFEHEARTVLARLGDVPPLVEDTPAGPRLSPGTLERRKASANGRVPAALHVLVWAPDDGKIVRLSLPLWLLRLVPDGAVKVDNVDLEQLKLSVEDLERAGPGPVLVRDARDSRVLVWTE